MNKILKQMSGELTIDSLHLHVFAIFGWWKIKFYLVFWNPFTTLQPLKVPSWSQQEGFPLQSHDDETLQGIEEEVWLSGEGTQLEPGDPEFKSSSDHWMH